MWTYSQSTGELVDALGEVVGTGYSGHGDGKNNPDMEQDPDVGPIPLGLWHIGEAFDDLTTPDHAGKGPCVMRLTPDETTETYGRTGFELHGDSAHHPGMASLGCIVQDHDTRVAVSLSPDKLLNVARTLPGAA